MQYDSCNIDIIYCAFDKAKCNDNIELESYLIAYRELNRYSKYTKIITQINLLITDNYYT